MSFKSCDVYNQYLNTNLDKFITGLCNISKYYNSITQTTLNNYLDVHNSQGKALDNLGKLLNFNRYITFNDPLDVVIATTPGIDEYQVLFDDFKKCRLNDDSYRKILTIILQTRNTVASVTTLTKIISEAVEADVFVGDAMDMRYITYYFLDLIPGWLEVTMHNYDILPRPAGMAVQYISAISRFFGFLVDQPQVDYEETAKAFTSFWKSRFPENILGQIHYPLAKIINNPESDVYLQNLTLEEWTAHGDEWGLLQQQQETDYLQWFQNQRTITAHSQRDALLLPKVKEWLGTSFRQYSDVIHDTSLQDDVRERRMYSPMLTQIKALKKHYLLTKVKNLNHQIEAPKKDPRVNLFYDRKSGWYFYKEPKEDGTFIPEYQANLYQDDCGLWYPQDPLEIQLLKKEIVLRHPNYANNKRTKTLADPMTSPFFAKYISLFTPETPAHHRDDLKQIIENLHSAVKIWHEANLINKDSFRAVLDFEYRNASMVQYRNYLERRYTSSPSDDRDDQKYWKYIYEDLNNYYGKNRSYRDVWNDRDTNAPVYKRKMFLKYQRYLVMKAKDDLMTLYSDSNRIYNQNTMSSLMEGEQSTFPVISMNLISEVLRMNGDLGRDFYTDYHLSISYGARKDSGQGFDWYSQVQRKNGEVDDDSSYNYRRISELKDAAKAYDQASSSCRHLANMCSNGQNISGQHWHGWYCFLKNGIERGVDYSSQSGNDNISWNAHSYWTSGSRACTKESTVDWYSSKADQMATAQRENAQDARHKASEAERKYNQAQREKQVRTIVTQDRTLADIIRHYNSYIPSSLVPKPDGPIIEYPDWQLPPDELSAETY